MAILGFEMEEIARLLALLEASGLDELIVQEEGRTLRIRGPRHKKSIHRTPRIPAEAGMPALPAESVETPVLPVPTRKAIAAPKTEAPVSLSEDQVALTSPMVGMFYRADKPGSPPFVNVGEAVSVGQTIGLIEAMKIFSEIPAEHAGVVVAILAQDGQLVQADTPLVILRKE
jgi:acetyl-CoA carboxylase biotin carboxyl carrier protein